MWAPFRVDLFRDRQEAGAKLAERLLATRGLREGVVLGLPRGGIVVAGAMAEELRLPLEALIVRKLGSPGNAELGIGAVSETGIRWVDENMVRITGTTDDYVEAQLQRQLDDARRRKAQYPRGTGLNRVRGETVIIVDDGIATGFTALVAIQTAKELGAKSVILAVPVASRQSVALLSPWVDELVVLDTPDPFLAVGMHYRRFDQTSNEEVVEWLRRVNASHGP